MRLAALAVVTLLLAASARAVIIDSGDGSGNTTAPPDDPGWDHVGLTGGLTAVYVGNGWVLTANHVPIGDVSLGGVLYPHVPGSKIRIQHDSATWTDLAVWQVDPAPLLPLLPVRAVALEPAAEVLMAGHGRNRGPATSWQGIDGYEWGVGAELRWGTNRAEQVGLDVTIGALTTRSFSTEFSEPPPGGPDPRCEAASDCPEAQGASGDSGGAVFAKDGGRWELAGITHSIGVFVGQPAETALYGNLTYGGDLSFYRDQILALVRPRCSNGVDDDGDQLVDAADPGCLAPEDDSEQPDCDGTDEDGDGVGDVCDNCLLAPNPEQLDTDGDLYGNACDADYDQNGRVGSTDFNRMRSAFGTSLGDPAYDPECDHTADDTVGAPDLNVLFGSFADPPGPSGLVP